MLEVIFNANQENSIDNNNNSLRIISGPFFLILHCYLKEILDTGQA